MARDERTFIMLHDGMPDHPKVDGLSDAAFRLLVATWCWCSRHLTDGHVPAATWAKRATPKVRKELLDAGLAEPTDSGVYMHDYTNHQRTAAQVAEDKAKHVAAGRKGGLAKAANRGNRDVAGATAGASGSVKQGAKQPPKQTRSKLVPDTEVVTDVTTQTEQTAGLRPAADDSASAPPEPLSVTQRSKIITDAYAATEPMCRWPAINGIVIRAIQAEAWTDDEIQAGILRLAGEGRSVTLETLRIELAGQPPPRRNGRHAPTSTERLAGAPDLVAELRALEAR